MKGESGTYASIKEQSVNQLGASFESLDGQKASSLGISGGVVVKNLQQGALTEQTRIKEGFIITKINDQRVTSVDGLKQAWQMQVAALSLAVFILISHKENINTH